MTKPSPRLRAALVRNADLICLGLALDALGFLASIFGFYGASGRIDRARARIARRLKAEARVAAALDQLKARVRDGML